VYHITIHRLNSIKYYLVEIKFSGYWGNRYFLVTSELLSPHNLVCNADKKLTMPKRLQHCLFVLGRSVGKMRPLILFVNPCDPHVKCGPKINLFISNTAFTRFKWNICFSDPFKKSRKNFVCSFLSFVCPKTSSSYLYRFCVPSTNFLIIRLYVESEFTIPNDITLNLIRPRELTTVVWSFDFASIGMAQYPLQKSKML